MTESCYSRKKMFIHADYFQGGSTGNPKGVMISHGNCLNQLKSIFLGNRFGTLKIWKDIYIAYLPLAHVIELTCELGCLLHGIKMGYSSPQTSLLNLDLRFNS